jgi:hypothetical protein
MRFLTGWVLALGFTALTLMGAEAAPAKSAPSAPRKVDLGVYILDIGEINEPAGEFSIHVLLGTYWRDPTRVFEGTEPRVFREDGASGEANAGWRPMVEFIRATAPAEVSHALLRVFPDGRVEYEREMNVRIATHLDLRRLPFDRQQLKLELESFQYLAGDVELVLPPANMRMVPQISLPQWEPRGLTGDVKPAFREVFQETYSRATVTIDVKRHYHFYLWQMIVPLGIVLGMAFAVFFLPPADLSDRMSVIIASLLTVVALSYSLHSGLPQIPYLTIIDWLFLLAYVFLALAMAGMVWISNLHGRDEAKAHRYDRLLRWAYPGAYVLAAGVVIIKAL